MTTTSDTSSASAGQRPGGPRWLMLVVLHAGQFMALLDVTTNKRRDCHHRPVAARVRRRAAAGGGRVPRQPGDAADHRGAAGLALALALAVVPLTRTVLAARRAAGAEDSAS